ncbi:MAG: hypothetical protein WCG90_08415 [Chitinophagia bacterium]
MTELERVEQFYKEFPNASLKAAAKHLGKTEVAVKACRNKLIAKGLLAKQDPNQAHRLAVKDECEKVGLPLEDVSNYWYKGEHFSIHVRNQKVSLLDIADQIINEMKAYAPKYKPIKPYKKGNHLMVINPADVHIGKLCSAYETGDTYNENIARERVIKGVNALTEKSKLFGVDKILTVIGADILHVDNAKSTTTSGTFQDTNMMWYDAFNFAFKLYIETIETMLAVAPVHINYSPSNHDYVSGFMLAQSVEAWFRNNKHITFNVSPSHRKYFNYGKNLIGTTHGDGAKHTDLALLMAHESGFWVDCPFRYMYTEHIHHKFSKDYMSVNVESFRSPSGTDSWHHRNGYQHAPKAIEAFVHHHDYGQVARLTEYM